MIWNENNLIERAKQEAGQIIPGTTRVFFEQNEFAGKLHLDQVPIAKFTGQDRFLKYLDAGCSPRLIVEKVRLPTHAENTQSAQ